MFFSKVCQISNSARRATSSIAIVSTLIGDVGRIVETILAMPRFKKSKYMALACIAKTELVPVLLRSEHNLAEELLDVAKDIDLSSQVF